MTTRVLNRMLLLAALGVACPAGTARAQAPDPLAKTPGWQPAAAAEVRSQAFAWLDDRELDAATEAEAKALWPDVPDATTGAELLDRLARTLALADPNARRVVQLCAGPRQQLAPPSHAWLADAATPPLLGNNLRLLYGRWLASERLFDESRRQLEGLRPEDVVDPASLLFYQAVVFHRLLERDAGLGAIEQLLLGAPESPQRYVAVARLMEADLSGLEDDTLDHIARRMEDVHRRLDLGRSGSKVREIEDGVIESLDKLIEEIEAKQQASSGADSVQSSRPAEESRILGGKGPGEVVKKSIGSSSGWGNLPPKDREQAMQQIGREFPSHYRDAIEQYFRKLANQWSEGE